MENTNKHKTVIRTRCNKTGKILFIDKDTGEELDYEERTIPKRKTYESKRFFMVDQDRRSEFLDKNVYGPDATLTLIDLKVLLHIETLINYGNVMSFTQSIVSEKVRIDRTNISKSFRKLAKTGYILSFEPKPGDQEYTGDKRKRHYIINPSIIWKGKPKDRKIAISKYRPGNGNVVHANF